MGIARCGGGRPRGVVLTVAATALAAAAVTAQAAHPFYEDLLRRGTEDFNRRDYEKAVRRLRIACFGLLEEPQLLTEGLTRLALAQAGANDRAGFAATFQRIAELEERFAAYSGGTLSGESRAAFEAMAVRLLPPATLAASPVFSRLVPAPAEILSQWPPAKRRKELEKRVHQEPDDIRWRLALAELELGEGRVGAAWAQADAALTLAPGNVQARRLRGRVLAAQGKWAAAAQELAAVGVDTDPEAAKMLLLALIRLERWEEAERLAASLPASLAARDEVRALAAAAAARRQP